MNYFRAMGTEKISNCGENRISRQARRSFSILIKTILYHTSIRKPYYLKKKRKILTFFYAFVSILAGVWQLPILSVHMAWEKSLFTQITDLRNLALFVAIICLILFHSILGHSFQQERSSPQGTSCAKSKT